MYSILLLKSYSYFVRISSQQQKKILSYHQLGEHAVQLIISWHRQ